MNKYILTIAPILSPVILSGNILVIDILCLILMISIVFKGFSSSKFHILLLIPFLFLSLISFQIFGFSSLRLIFNLIIVVFLVSSKIDYQNYYLKSVIFYSLWLMLAYVFYFVFNINLNLDFGEFAYLGNTASDLSHFQSDDLRIGGAFREPNWLAIYISPALSFRIDIKTKILIAITLVICASSFGILIVLFWFIFEFMMKFNFKRALIIITVGTIIFSFLADKFSRTFSMFNFAYTNTDNSSLFIRVIQPWSEVFSNFSVLPQKLDIDFKNTLVSIIVYFGFPVALYFIFFLYRKSKNSFLFIIVFLAYISEGFYGRFEFIILTSLVLGGQTVINRKKYGEKISIHS